MWYYSTLINTYRYVLILNQVKNALESVRPVAGKIVAAIVSDKVNASADRSVVLALLVGVRVYTF